MQEHTIFINHEFRYDLVEIMLRRTTRYPANPNLTQSEFARVKDENGRLEYVKTNEGRKVPALLALTQEELLALYEALTEYMNCKGIQTTPESTMRGQLERTGVHLKDMRRIAFKQLGMAEGEVT